jgi:copper homeostasis protein (lipoprotein)
MHNPSIQRTLLLALALAFGVGCASSGGSERESAVATAAAPVGAVNDTIIQGMYSYMADAGRFRECRSGVSYPVAMVGDNAALERAYAAARSEPGAPLLVTVRGHVEERPATEGDRSVRSLVVDRFDRVWPGASCDNPALSATHGTPENRAWKLVSLGDQPAPAVNAPELRLDTGQKQAVGVGGCNRFTGHYELNGDSLRLGPLASTKRACLDAAANRFESAFLKALDDARTWRITGDTLVLSGQSGPLARFATGTTPP